MYPSPPSTFEADNSPPPHDRNQTVLENRSALFNSKYLINASWPPHQWNQVLSIEWDDRQMIMHPVSPGLRSDACTWHWLWGWWKVHGSETSAFTLFHQLGVSSKAWPWGGKSSGFREMNTRGSRRCFPAVHQFQRNLCWNFPCSSLRFTLHVGNYTDREESCEEEAARSVFPFYFWEMGF